MAANDPATIGAASVGVVTDTAACLPQDLLQRWRINVAPLMLMLDGRAYRDGLDLVGPDFYDRLRSTRTAPSTSGVSPRAFLEAFRSTGKEAVLCITVSSRFSATHANALVAARDAAAEGIEVCVLDSEYATMAQGYVALAAARAAEAGASMEACAAAASAAISRVGLVMMLEGLEHLARGGRVPRVAAWATSVLQVKPVVEFREREIRLAGRARTRRRGLEATLDLLERRLAGATRVHLAVHHADAPEDAAILAEAARSRLRPASVLVTEFTQVMTAHVGPGLVGFAYWREA